MKTAFVAMSLALAAAAPAAHAQANNNPPPLNPIFGLTGQAQSTTYTQHTFSFIAQYASTNLTFALRNDPYYIELDDVTLSTGGGANLITNGGFEGGPVGSNAPTGWTYLNQYGATAGGVVGSGCGHTGADCYYDGAVQAYDAITQVVATTVGATYSGSFWVAVNTVGGTGLYQPLSTNGDTVDHNGNGIDLFVYATQGAPVAASVPEPASWALMIGGFGFAGAALRRRQRLGAHLSLA